MTNARSYISEVRFPKHILTRKWDGRSRVYNLHKDLGMAVDLDHKIKTENTSGKDALAFLKKAMGLGIQDPDFTLLYRDFEKIVKIRKKNGAPFNLCRRFVIGEAIVRFRRAFGFNDGATGGAIEL